MNSQERLLANASKRIKARAAAEVAEAPPPDPRDLNPLHDVAFASPSAQRHAEHLGLTWKHFARTLHVASSMSGYTKVDIVAIAKEG